jgi:O-antigen/teichoic acid export membrane protein
MFKRILFNIQNPLFKNSFFIILTSISMAGFGFIFWIIAAKLYNTSDVGVATALISSINLLVLFSLVGIDQSIIRFFPSRPKNKVLYTSLIIVTLISLLFGFIFILGLPFWSPNLTIIYKIIPSFCLILISAAIFSIASNIFLALRHSDYFFYQNLFLGARILLLFPFILFGALGIFYSLGVIYVLALFVPIFIIFRFDLQIFGFDTEFVKESLNFSAANYLISIFSATPTLLLPIIILNLGGDEMAGIYYITYNVCSLLFIIPTAFGTMLFVEGSHGKLLKGHIIQGLFGILFLLIPLILILLLFGEKILGLIGTDYIQGYGLLVVMLFSSLGMVIFQIYCSIKKVQKNTMSLVIMSAVNCFLLLALSYFFYPRYGIIGVGFAWLISYSVIGLIIMPYLFYEIKTL